MLLGLGRFQISAEISMRLYQRVYEISGWLVADPMFLPLLLPSSSLLHLYSSLLPLTFFSSRSHPSFLPLFPLPSHVPYSYFYCSTSSQLLTVVCRRVRPQERQWEVQLSLPRRRKEEAEQRRKRRRHVVLSSLQRCL